MSVAHTLKAIEYAYKFLANIISLIHSRRPPLSLSLSLYPHVNHNTVNLCPKIKAITRLKWDTLTKAEGGNKVYSKQ